MKNVKLITVIIVISLLVGFVAGILGFFVGKYYITNLSLVNSLYIPDQNETGNKDIVIQEVKKVVVEQDDRKLQIIDKTENSIFKIYRKKNLLKSGINSYYSDIDFIGYASVATSDGWLVTQNNIKLNPKTIVVSDESNSYIVTKVIIDPLTNLQFLKLEVTGLKVVGYSQVDNISVGQSVFGYIPFDHSLLSSYIQDNNYKKSINSYSKVKSVESNKQQILLGDSLGAKSNGLPLINLNGDILGISIGNNLAIKSSYINFLLKSVLKDGEIVKPYLGINYINLSEVAGSKKVSSGYIIVKNSKGVAIDKNSKLKDELKEGDIIIEIEGVQVKNGRDLSDYIYEYSMSNVINFKVISGGEQKIVAYTLEEK